MTATSIPSAETRPTDDRAGPRIEPTRVACPFCGRQGVTEETANLCRCGRWFAVVDGQEVAR